MILSDEKCFIPPYVFSTLLLSDCIMSYLGNFQIYKMGLINNPLNKIQDFRFSYNLLLL